jgi:hypothetical protein
MTLAQRCGPALSLAAVLMGCSPCSSPRALFDGGVIAQAWPEANGLFHQDPRWLGADDAYSVDLSGGRVLWLFGDTFVATSDAGLRSQSTMVHNTVGIQTGYDPSQATIAFQWQADGGQPAAFFGPDDAGAWFWPGHGVMVGPQLVVFLSRITASSGGLGFQAAGWAAVRVDDPEDDPAHWRPVPLPTPAATLGVTFGETATVFDGGLFVYGAEDVSHAVHVLRWPVGAVSQGDLSAPQWWTPSGWVDYGSLTAPPAPLFADGATELRVQADPRGSGWLEVQTVGFGAATLDVRSGGGLTGPWGAATAVFTPPESSQSGVLVYAGKTHPELIGAPAVATYATNTTDFATLVADMSLYFPEFVRLSFSPDAG